MESPDFELGEKKKTHTDGYNRSLRICEELSDSEDDVRILIECKRFQYFSLLAVDEEKF